MNYTTADRMALINVILSELHNADNDPALYNECLLVDLRPAQLLVRVEWERSERPGRWFHGPFNTLADANRYRDYLLELGIEGVRRVNALPEMWRETDTKIHGFDCVRTYQVLHEMPAFHSVIKWKEEKNPHAAMQFYSGEGQQLAVPIFAASQRFGMDVVRRVPAEIRRF